MLALAPVAGAPGSSGDLCRAALVVYVDLFARLPSIDPDAGFGEVYVSGTRWLEARAKATEWIVPAGAVRAAELLFESARNLPADEIADWICLYPRRFLATIDRRQGTLSRSVGGRRAIDRAPTNTGRPITPR